MAFNDLHSIKNYTGYNTLRRLNSSRRNLPNRISSNAGNRFKNILTAFQSANSDNKTNGYVSIYRRPATQPLGLRWGFETASNKTRGLTIADYRARPVISKSRCRQQPEPATAKLKNTATNRFSKYGTPAVIKPAVIKNDPLKNASLCGQDSKYANFVEKPDRTAHHPKVKLTQQEIIDQNVQKAAAKYDLSPDLIRGVIQAESNFKVRAISSAGAQGLMQLMPATAKELGVNNPFDIAQNIDGGAKYLRKMLDRFGGNVRTALAAYNAGPGTVIKYNGRVPYPETRQYVKRVLRFSRQMV